MTQGNVPSLMRVKLSGYGYCTHVHITSVSTNHSSELTDERRTLRLYNSHERQENKNIDFIHLHIDKKCFAERYMYTEIGNIS